MIHEADVIAIRHTTTAGRDATLVEMRRLFMPLSVSLVTRALNDILRSLLAPPPYHRHDERRLRPGLRELAEEAFVVFKMGQRWLQATLILLPTLCFCGSQAQASDSGTNDSWLGSVLGLPRSTKITVTDAELQSLGCVVGGGAAALGVVVFSGAAIVATGGRNAGTATKVAIPVIAAASMAGCLTGSNGALGIAWLFRNSGILAGKVVDALPDVPPVGTILPGSR